MTEGSQARLLQTPWSSEEVPDDEKQPKREHKEEQHPSTIMDLEPVVGSPLTSVKAETAVFGSYNKVDINYYSQEPKGSPSQRATHSIVELKLWVPTL